MKLRSTILSFGLAHVLFLTVCRGAGSSDQGPDTGFENVKRDALVGWRDDKSAGHPFEKIEVIELDPRFVRSGSYSVKLVQTHSEKIGHLYSQESIPVEPDETYTVAFWAKGEGKVGASLYLYKLIDGNEASYGSTALKKSEEEEDRVFYLLNGEDDWQHCTYTFQLKFKDAEMVKRVRLVIRGSGVVYVDDCSFEAPSAKSSPGTK